MHGESHIYIKRAEKGFAFIAKHYELLDIYSLTNVHLTAVNCVEIH